MFYVRYLQIPTNDIELRSYEILEEYSGLDLKEVFNLQEALNKLEEDKLLIIFHIFDSSREITLYSVVDDLTLPHPFGEFYSSSSRESLIEIISDEQFRVLARQKHWSILRGFAYFFLITSVVLLIVFPSFRELFFTLQSAVSVFFSTFIFLSAKYMKRKYKRRINGQAPYEL
ncbi:hypothetical protein [Thermococcus sp.]